MWSVIRPRFSAEETYNLCISRVQDECLKTRLLGISSDIAEASAEYAARAMNDELHLIRQTNGVSGLVTTEEMVAVYEMRMAGKRGPGRSIYDALKLLPSNGICPFCDHGQVSTLDHLLPKALFPALTVTPDNLVGVCKECNTAKLSAAPSSAQDAVLHPYFNDISSANWLRAYVVEGCVASVIFHVVRISAWSEDLNSRLGYQFQMLGLGRLYASQAAREISGQRKDMVRIFEARGEDGLRAELQYKFETWNEYRPNCWQSALFRALSESDWYCREGFRNR